MNSSTRFWLLAILLAVTAPLFAQSNAPTNLTGTAPKYNQVVLTWKDNSTNETKFEIELQGLTGIFSKIGEVTANTTTYTDNTVQANNSYTYRVRAVLATGAGTTYSNNVTVTTPQEPPGIPTGLSATAQNNTSIKLTWNNAGSGSTPTSYQVERQTPGGAFQLIQSVAYSRAPTYTDNGVSGGKQYCYRVRAISGGGTSDYSTTSCTTTPLGPTNVTNLSATTLSSSSIKLTWTPYGKESSLTIERRVGQTGSWAKAGSASSNDGTFTDTGLSASTEYCYRIGEDGYDYSAIVCKTTSAPAPVPPVAPSGLTVSAISASQLQVFWNDANVVPVTFEISRTDKPGGTYTVVQADFAQKIYNDTGLPANTQYCYKVRAKNSAGLYSSYTSEACGTTKAPPAVAPKTPTSLDVKAISSAQVNLQWTDASDNETEFQVERATGSSTTGFAKIQTLPANSTTFSDQTVQPNTQYCYRVRAANNVGPSDYTEVKCATTPQPPAGVPQNLAATATSTTQIHITWTAVSGASGYQLERSLDGSSNWTTINNPSGGATSYDDTGLTPNTRYYYRIKAINAAGVPGDYSNVVNAITPDAPPAKPVRLVITSVTYNQIGLTWAAGSSNQTSFRLERSTDGTNWGTLTTVDGNTTTYTDQTVQPQTHYYYRIRAINGAGVSDPSDPVDATTPVGPPATPQKLTATAVSTTQLKLTWEAVATASSILIQRSPDGSNWTSLTTVAGTATDYTDTGLTPNTRYYYRIQGTNATGTGPFSDPTNAITPDAPPASPARLTATAVSATQINLTWADVSTNETGFEVERSPDGATGWTKIADAPANATAYQNTGLTPNTHYYYRIRAVNAAGPSAYSNPADATTPDIAPPAPANLSATPASATQINLSWTDQSANETGFEVERATTQTGTFTKLADLPANTTTYQDQGLTPAGNYCYRVRAKNTIGPSGYSNVACAVTPDVPPVAPARLTATATSPTTVTLAWADLSSNESGFEVERSDGTGGTYTKIADLPANTTTYTSTGLTDVTQYCYRIRAKNAAGNSAYTDPACATTPLGSPAVPQNLTAQLQDYDQIRLNWSPLSPRTVTISIERATSASGPFTEIKQIPAANATTYVDPGLTEFTTYYYRIRGINTAGQSDYSNVAQARINEVIIAVEDEWINQTQAVLANGTLLMHTEWHRVSQAQIQLHSLGGQVFLNDTRRVRPTDSWSYSLTNLPAGLYVLAMAADGLTFTKRILVP